MKPEQPNSVECNMLRVWYKHRGCNMPLSQRGYDWLKRYLESELGIDTSEARVAVVEAFIAATATPRSARATAPARAKDTKMTREEVLRELKEFAKRLLDTNKLTEREAENANACRQNG